MMTDLFSYLVKVNITFSVLYGVYYLFMRNLSWHKINRTILIAILILSLVLPALKLPSNSIITNQYLWTENLNQLVYESEEVFIENDSYRAFNAFSWLMTIYSLGCLLFLFRFFKQIAFIFKCMRSGEKDLYKGHMLYRINGPKTAFSFFHTIFVSKSLSKDKSFDSIIKHEKAHVKQWHSLDVMVAELFLIVNWFNPFVFHMKRVLRETHEYLADFSVINDGHSVSDYLRLMVTHMESTQGIGVSNHFANHILKRRIEMITKNKKSKLTKITYLIMIPMVILLLQAFSFATISEKGIVINNIQNNKPSIHPLQNPKLARLTSEFGKRIHPITKDLRMHNGIDLAAPEGTPVVATADGKIILIEAKDVGYGNRIIIQHDNTFATSYSQLSDFNVTIEQMIKAGEIIGYVGSSGTSTAAHLHYEVRENGKPVDPQLFFKK